MRRGRPREPAVDPVHGDDAVGLVERQVPATCEPMSPPDTANRSYPRSVMSVAHRPATSRASSTRGGRPRSRTRACPARRRRTRRRRASGPPCGTATRSPASRAPAAAGGSRCRRAHVQHVDADAVDDRPTRRQGGERRSVRREVEAVRPVRDERPQLVDVDPERPARADRGVGPPGGPEPRTEVRDGVVVDPRGLGHGGTLRRAPDTPTRVPADGGVSRRARALQLEPPIPCVTVENVAAPPPRRPPRWRPPPRSDRNGERPTLWSQVRPGSRTLPSHSDAALR